MSPEEVTVGASTVRVRLPGHLRELAGAAAEVECAVDAPATVQRVLDAVEARYPMLRGTIRDSASGERRAYIRYFACGRDLSHESVDGPLPEAVGTGSEPLRVVGAIAGG